MLLTVASQVKQTLAALKGAQGTLRMYEAQTRDEEVKNAYNGAIEVTGKVIEDIETRLRQLELQEPQYKGN